MKQLDTIAQLEQVIMSTSGISLNRRSTILALLESLRADIEAENSLNDSTIEYCEAIIEFDSEYPELEELTRRACKILSDIGV